MSFKILKKDKNSDARTGQLETDHGTINTPIFMPVGTLGAVKSLRMSDLTDFVEAEIILGNTYHLYLRPGIDVIQKAGGLHKFIGWDRPLLTDSGGYQVYSLSSTSKIKEEGTIFQSHIDGSKHLFSPENVIEIQQKIGADIIMVFDECTAYPVEKRYAKKAMDRTHRWLKRCITKFEASEGVYDYNQVLAPIVQGSTFPDLRKISAEVIASKDMQINAIGGLSVGEPHHLMYEMTAICCEILPKEKPRYLMGVGTPSNLLEAISLGVDMFDCVLPTRNARHGLIYTWDGEINIKNAKWKEDLTPIDEKSKSPLSKFHNKAFFRHLIQHKEMLGAEIASMHNLCFYLELMQVAREKISEGVFSEWKDQVIPTIKNRL